MSIPRLFTQSPLRQLHTATSILAPVSSRRSTLYYYRRRRCHSSSSGNALHRQKPHGLKVPAEIGRCAYGSSSQRQDRHSEQKPGASDAPTTAGRSDSGLQDSDGSALPAPPPLPGSGGQGQITLDVSKGESSTVKLGHLGPIVVNADGTTGRVANWDGMTVHERDTTMKLLNRRNKVRLDALKAKEDAQGGGQA